MIDLKPFPRKQMVYLTSELSDRFEAQYTGVRQKEGRIYPDELVKNLPLVPRNHPHYREWNMRGNMSDRVLKHIRSLQTRQILDLGCGNGWFTNKLSVDPKTNVIGLDINLLELTQAARLFTKSNCQFVYGEVFDLAWPAGSFDQIILNSSIQYFPSLVSLVSKLLYLVVPGGEIHIWDSPWYKTEKEAAAAGERTKIYYQRLGLIDLPAFYHHHTWSSLEQFQFKLMYNPDTMWSRAFRRLAGQGSFFPWIMIKK